MINIGKKGKKKVILAAVLLVVTAFSFAGVVFSYFSDTIEQTTNITIGTLKISGSYSITVNGVEANEGIKNLNPGDIINITGNIVNNGSKSAWIREKIDFDSSDEAILNHIEVYQGNLASSEIEEATALSLTDGISVSGNKVIDGTGTAAEVEDGEDYEYLNSNEYSFAFTIYFSTAATNEAQGKNFDINFTVQALQFRNNSVSEPSEVAWSTVASAS